MTSTQLEGINRIDFAPSSILVCGIVEYAFLFLVFSRGSQQDIMVYKISLLLLLASFGILNVSGHSFTHKPPTTETPESSGSEVTDQPLPTVLYTLLLRISNSTVRYTEYGGTCRGFDARVKRQIGQPAIN